NIYCFWIHSRHCDIENSTLKQGIGHSGIMDRFVKGGKKE
ncbi:unnamed protein product, partial [marine sediment metagenome]